ncbi:hypothetical protein RHMOL_Rhmol12G0117600 [Rhododendron molle]|uniref:Uncharacterized protein n=1 Tax=Rhododendron molle TaxID=49168 RepID=A0ACC0LH72_RHOML|nr:hypothetical protein RHMOL_Rhmol12G0117600 [Rhododendron molle]
MARKQRVANNQALEVVQQPCSNPSQHHCLFDARRRDLPGRICLGCSGDILFRPEDPSDSGLLFELCHEAFHKFNMGLCIESLRKPLPPQRALPPPQDCRHQTAVKHEAIALKERR